MRGKYAIFISYKDETHLEYEFTFDTDDNIMVIAYNPQNISVGEGKTLKRK